MSLNPRKFLVWANNSTKVFVADHFEIDAIGFLFFRDVDDVAVAVVAPHHWTWVEEVEET